MSGDTDTLPTLYTHTLRPQWGAAMLAWTHRDKRAFQFEDGELRRFKEGYYELLEPLDKPMDDTLELIDTLSSALDLTQARGEARAEARTKGRKLVTLKEQMGLFTELFPKGFEDPAFIAAYRADANGKARKRHREPHMETAQRELSESVLSKHISRGDFDKVHAALTALCKATSLTSGAKHTALLARLPSGRHDQVARSLHDLLYGEGPLPARFDAWIKALSYGSETPTWMLATTPLSLVHPERHVPVKPSVFRQQIKWMAPRLKFNDVPTGKQYKRLRKMCKQVAERLREAGHSPRDMHDTQAFIWETLRPKAQKRIRARRSDG